MEEQFAKIVMPRAQYASGSRARSISGAGTRNSAFKLLEREKVGIEQRTGPLNWMELLTKQDCRIIKYHGPIDIEDREQWPSAFGWLSEQARLFLDAFCGPIQRLAIVDEAEDDVEEHDEA